MISSEVNDIVFEALFSQAVIDNFNEELDSYALGTESNEQYKYSSQHENRMRALFLREKRKENIRTAARYSKRIAAVIILTLSILFGSLMFVPEVRAVVFETVVEWFAQFVRFPSNATDEEKTNLEPTFIPDGFWEDHRDSGESITIILYTSHDGVSILFESQLVDAQLSVDNEGYEYELKQFEAIDYHIFTAIDNRKESTIVWEANGQRYQISSVISTDEILMMALSVLE